MKKLIAAILTATILSLSVGVFAMPIEFSGGVKDEFEYEEFAFLSGTPIKFKGTCKVTITEGQASGTGSKATDKFDQVPVKSSGVTSVKKQKKTVTYAFKLTSTDSSTPGTIDRQMTYETIYDKNSEKGQTVADTQNTKMKESVTIGNDKYDLKNYEFSKSDLIDNRPASDFYSGNLTAKKYYTINSTEGTAIVNISGGEVGYSNFWGNTGTQVLDYVINVEKSSGTGSSAVPDAWQGTVKIQSSDSITKSVKYSENDANYSSFNGGYMKLTNREMVSKVEYDLPKFKQDGAAETTDRNTGTQQLSKKMEPKIERLLVPKLKDIGGHWAEDDINRLYSLGIFDEMLSFYTPDVPMTRKEYVKAIMKASNIEVPIQASNKTSSSRNKTVETSPFNDVNTNDKYYSYIKEAVSKGIIEGVTPDQFMPDVPLTRSEAVVIIIRALGFDNLAPAPGYRTSFDDDNEIADWAKDSVYMAKEIGLVEGDGANRFNPNKVMSRAEASAMISRFLKFLEKDLQKDYRENIIKF